MKSIFTHISLLGVLAFVFSCSPPPAYLGSGFHGKDMAYWAKPATKDSAKISAIYSTGSLSSSRGYQTGDQLFIAQGAVYQSHTSKSTNVSYGIFGYVGRYSIGSGTAPLDKFQGNYGLYGTGIRASFNFNSITSKSFDWRFLGVDVAYSREFGAFTDLRQSVPGDSAKSKYGNYYAKTNFNPVRSDNMFSWGITSEFIFKQKGTEYFSLKYFWGRSENSYESIYSNKFFHLSNTTVAYHHEKLFASVQISQLFSHSTLSLGLGYRLGNERIK